ncbi:MAG: hypothetical protein ACK4NC_04860 [Candidatus Gracilibacteria bacterium]
MTSTLKASETKTARRQFKTLPIEAKIVGIVYMIIAIISFLSLLWIFFNIGKEVQIEWNFLPKNVDLSSRILTKLEVYVWNMIGTLSATVVFGLLARGFFRTRYVWANVSFVLQAIWCVLCVIGIFGLIRTYSEFNDSFENQRITESIGLLITLLLGGAYLLYASHKCKQDENFRANMSPDALEANLNDSQKLF